MAGGRCGFAAHFISLPIMRRDEHFWRTANIHEQCSWVFGERTRTPPLKGVRMFATVDGYKTSEVSALNYLMTQT